MASKRKKSLSNKVPIRLRDRLDLAWRNFILFFILFLFSFALYNLTTNELFKNFFGIISVILGFLSLAILIALIVLAILKSNSK